ncbi:hypothetical protein JAAARDRAFT_489712 [Jaapia argillacea MUCL 33604]|uniref:Uncharacterized protein n=1 Tax=Jaapia argillacea MUCL 33604 TaxID=933084 RepID=A0A067PE25_9AGAM|nr:hypothetical protein JAAARDRAFT_489712 [Jaapia argillacea MUCL 33604]
MHGGLEELEDWGRGGGGGINGGENTQKHILDRLNGLTMKTTRCKSRRRTRRGLKGSDLKPKRREPKKKKVRKQEINVAAFTDEAALAALESDEVLHLSFTRDLHCLRNI